MISRVLSPSDLAARSWSGRVAVGGRLAQISSGRCLLADALGSTEVVWSGVEPSALEVGALVVVEGCWEAPALVGASLVSLTPAPLPSGTGEVARFQWQGLGPRLAARSRALQVVRRYFDEQGFLELETPFRLSAPGLDSHVEPLAAAAGWLVTSPELHMKRLLVGGLPRIYQLARCTRDDEQGPRHQPEFTLLEWYRAFSTLQAIASDTEQLVRNVVTELTGQDWLERDGKRIELGPPFERLTVREAFARFAGGADALELAENDQQRYFQLLVDHVEPALARFERPVMLCEYPRSQAALARPLPSDPRVCERFELYLAGIELCNAYGELTCPDEQRRRFQAELVRREAQGLPALPLDEPFLAALREGLPPCGGNALGFDRLVMLATGAAALDQVLAFPATALP